MEIDIRDNQDWIIDKIVFARHTDDYEDLSYSVEKIASEIVGISEYDKIENTTKFIECVRNKADAINLIRALEKAIQLGFWNNPQHATCSIVKN